MREEPTPVQHKDLAEYLVPSPVAPTAAAATPPDVADVSLDVALYSLLYFFALSACVCRPEVTVTSSSPTPSVSHRGIVNKIHPSLSSPLRASVSRRFAAL